MTQSTRVTKKMLQENPHGIQVTQARLKNAYENHDGAKKGLFVSSFLALLLTPTAFVAGGVAGSIVGVACIVKHVVIIMGGAEHGGTFQKKPIQIRSINQCSLDIDKDSDGAKKIAEGAVNDALSSATYERNGKNVKVGAMSLRSMQMREIYQSISTALADTGVNTDHMTDKEKDTVQKIISEEIKEQIKTTGRKTKAKFSDKNVFDTSKLAQNLTQKIKDLKLHARYKLVERTVTEALKTRGKDDSATLKQKIIDKQYKKLVDEGITDKDIKNGGPQRARTIREIMRRDVIKSIADDSSQVTSTKPSEVAEVASRVDSGRGINTVPMPSLLDTAQPSSNGLMMLL